MAKPKLLFYCQHLLGVGHVTRSLALCAELVELFDVTFLQGGPDIGKTLDHESFCHVFLPPFLMRETDSSLYDPVHDQSVEAIFQQRADLLRSLVASCDFAYVVTELFPFGRNKFRPEVFDLIRALKAKNPQLIVAASLRDILVEKKKPGFAEKVLQTVRDFYDCVLVHSDEKVLRIEESFPEALQISDHLVYTGFVTEGPRKNQPLEAVRRREVLVSQGGGSVGEEMSLAVAKTAALLPDLKFRFALGPYAPEFLAPQILQIAKDTQAQNIEVLPFLKNFEEELAQVELSISLAGYNTVMNVFNTKTMALVYPYQANFEQTLRGQKLESTGALKVIYPHDLQPQILRKLIPQHLGGFPQNFKVSLEGAANSAKILRSWPARL